MKRAVSRQTVDDWACEGGGSTSKSATPSLCPGCAASHAPPLLPQNTSAPPPPLLPHPSRMIALAQRFEAGVLDTIARHRLAWTIKRLGCRDEYWWAGCPQRCHCPQVCLLWLTCCRCIAGEVLARRRRAGICTPLARLHGTRHPTIAARRPAATAPRNGGQAAASGNERLDYYMHLAALNRGVYLTPFHNMASTGTWHGLAPGGGGGGRISAGLPSSSSRSCAVQP